MAVGPAAGDPPEGGSPDLREEAAGAARLGATYFAIGTVTVADAVVELPQASVAL